MLIPIGGIAHAGARSISRVEVRVDGGPWQEAALRTPLSQLIRVLRRYDWPFQGGEHLFTARCCDGDGTPQIVTPTPPEPSGAAGLDSKRGTFSHSMSAQGERLRAKDLLVPLMRN
jgi:hypothetical protein